MSHARRRRRLRHLLLVASGLLVAGCSGAGTPVSPTEITDTATVTPRDTTPLLGLDRARLYRLVDDLERGAHGEVHSILVMRSGTMVVEEYFRGFSAINQHSLQSVTKSFASALTGIAIAQGDIASVKEEVLDFFPDWKDDLSRNALRASMTVEDVLTMRTGTDYHEVGPNAPHWELNRLPTGWDAFWLNRAMVRKPGTFWQYDSGGVIALSSMIRARYGEHAHHLADATLFGALGIQDRTWILNQEGHPHMGGGLSLTPRDMLKLGQLYLQGGRWGGEQVIPEDWVDASFTRHVEFALPPGSTQRMKAYGYLWWILEPDPGGGGQQDIYAAVGAGGQFVFVIPEYDMVVGVTSSVASGQQWGPVGFLYSDILPAVIK